MNAWNNQSYIEFRKMSECHVHRRPNANYVIAYVYVFFHHELHSQNRALIIAVTIAEIIKSIPNIPSMIDAVNLSSFSCIENGNAIAMATILNTNWLSASFANIKLMMQPSTRFHQR